MGSIKLSLRARNTPPSPIRRLAHLATAAKARGTTVFHLNIGQPDIETPQAFFDGIRRFDEKVLAYDPSYGNEQLRRNWSDYCNKTLAINTKPEQFLITTGASEALIFIFMTCCDPGDEIVIFDPTYANYIGFAAIAGVNLVQVPCYMKENFALPAREEIEKRITNRTRAILLCNPNNPTGTVYTRAELNELLDLCNQHNIFLIADETYREFVYDNQSPLSVLHLAPQSDKVIVVDSLSKRFSLCGARIGCLITSNEAVYATTLNLAQARLASPTLDQFAAAHMLKHIPLDFVEGVRKEYERRRDTLFEALSGIPGVKAHKPGGAFYAIVGLPISNAEQFASYLLSSFSYQGATTFVAPAAGFYMESGRGVSKVRIAYVLKEQAMKQAIEIVQRGIDSFKGV